MSRIDAPDVGLGPHVDWMMHRVQMATGVGALSEAVYGNTQLSTREREAARWVVAQLNACRVCQATDATDGEAHGIDASFYRDVVDWRATTSLSARERLAAEFAERFVRDHQAMDDDLWERLRAQYADDEIADLVLCCGTFLGLGRMLAVLGVDPPVGGLSV
jgi:alkylhydroperoxidase family enzyme